MISVRNAFIALLLLIPAALFAQSYHGEVRGLVADPSGSVLIGAKVTLIDESRKLTQDAVSDSSGSMLLRAWIQAPIRSWWRRRASSVSAARALWWVRSSRSRWMLR